MGSSCSTESEPADTIRYSRRLDDDEKETRLIDGDSSLISLNGLQQTNNAMANEVILLSTRNANLTQQLDEANKTINKLKHNMDEDSLIMMDVFKVCKILNIDFMDIERSKHSQIDIALDILQ
eukprot:337536_1